MEDDEAVMQMFAPLLRLMARENGRVIHQQLGALRQDVLAAIDDRLSGCRDCPMLHPQATTEPGPVWRQETANRYDHMIARLNDGIEIGVIADEEHVSAIEMGTRLERHRLRRQDEALRQASSMAVPWGIHSA